MLVQQPFDDYHVAPLAVELPMFLIDAHLAESEFADQSPAGGVLGKDARQQFPEAGLASGLDERQQSEAARAVAAERARDVDRRLRDARVALARPVGKRG